MCAKSLREEDLPRQIFTPQVAAARAEPIGLMSCGRLGQIATRQMLHLPSPSTVMAKCHISPLWSDMAVGSGWIKIRGTEV